MLYDSIPVNFRNREHLIMLFRDAFSADKTIKKQNYQYENQGGGYL